MTTSSQVSLSSLLRWSKQMWRWGSPSMRTWLSNSFVYWKRYSTLWLWQPHWDRNAAQPRCRAALWVKGHVFSSDWEPAFLSLNHSIKFDHFGSVSCHRLTDWSTECLERERQRKTDYSPYCLSNLILKATAGTRPSWRQWWTLFRSWRRQIPAWFMVSLFLYI